MDIELFEFAESREGGGGGRNGKLLRAHFQLLSSLHYFLD
jgi:hypothetical protein